MKKNAKDMAKAGGIGTVVGGAAGGIASICTTACTVGAVGGGPIGLGIGLVVGLGVYGTSKIMRKKKNTQTPQMDSSNAEIDHSKNDTI